jgi:hypothetical protein
MPEALRNSPSGIWPLLEISGGAALVAVGGLDLVYRWSLPLSAVGMHATELISIGMIVMGCAAIRTARLLIRQPRINCERVGSRNA